MCTRARRMRRQNYKWTNLSNLLFFFFFFLLHCCLFWGFIYFNFCTSKSKRASEKRNHPHPNTHIRTWYIYQSLPKIPHCWRGIRYEAISIQISQKKKPAYEIISVFQQNDESKKNATSFKRIFNIILSLYRERSLTQSVFMLYTHGVVRSNACHCHEKKIYMGHGM